MAYRNYDPEVDYSIRLGQMMAAGASAAEVEDVLNRRVTKALGTPGLEKYAYDSHYQAARDYIASKNQYPGTSGTGSAGSTAGAAASYTDPYAERLEAALDRLENREPFSYDPEDDPVYRSYASQYRREGERAGRDTLAQAATLTGGQASTAAVTAASQARDYYNSKLGDVVPQLYELAWEMYRAEQDDLESSLSALAGLSQTAYGRWQSAQNDAYEQWADQRDFAYGQYQDVLDRDAAAADRWQEQQEAAADSAAAAEKQAYTRAMAFLNAGVMPTDAMLEAAGIPKAQAQSLRAAALRKLGK